MTTTTTRHEAKTNHGATAMKTTTQHATKTASTHHEGDKTMTTKHASKTASTKTATAIASTIAATTRTNGVTDPLPTADPPKPPDGYVPAKTGRILRPMKTQVNLALKVATELTESPDYATWFGSLAPAASDVATALDTASAWTGKLVLAQTWYAYVRQQESLAWKQAFGKSDALRTPFEYRATVDASVATSLPSTAAFFAAPKERAAKAAASRKKAKKAAATTAAAAPAAPVTKTS